MPGSENTSDTIADGGILIGNRNLGAERLKLKTEKFWTFLAETTAACKGKAEN